MEPAGSGLGDSKARSRDKIASHRDHKYLPAELAIGDSTVVEEGEFASHFAENLWRQASWSRQHVGPMIGQRLYSRVQN